MHHTPGFLQYPMKNIWMQRMPPSSSTYAPPRSVPAPLQLTLIFMPMVELFNLAVRSGIILELVSRRQSSFLVRTHCLFSKDSMILVCNTQTFKKVQNCNSYATSLFCSVDLNVIKRLRCLLDIKYPVEGINTPYNYTPQCRRCATITCL